MAMKKFVCVILTVVLAGYLLGCGKKQQSLEEMQEPMSMESLGELSTQTTPEPESKIESAQTRVAPAPTPPVTETKLESLPPGGPYEPTAQEIQTALKNAGYYTGLVDGKIGPLTKKATEEFQKANNLKVDGKIGPKTWAVLSKYLNPEPATGAASTQR